VVSIVPQPVRVDSPTDARPYVISEDVSINANGDGAEAVAELFAVVLRAATGFAVPVASGDASADIVFIVADGEASTGPERESYTLASTAEGVRLGARSAEGLFRGLQTLRQLLPAAVEAGGAAAPRDGWTIAAASVIDHPRFGYRGVMLDVARHFFGVDDVKRVLDDVALLKINHLHLHLTDDQGWRLAIDAWPELTGVGASTSVNGDGGGFYTKAEYTEIVQYAADRFITVVPEIDMPGHTNAALAAYPDLTRDGVATRPYEGIEVGFSTLTVDSDTTYRFIEDVIREVAELTPGPFLHIGGDESLSTTEPDYLRFIARATAIAAATGKSVIGWHEMGASHELPVGTIGQYWSLTTPEADAAARAMSFVEQGGSVILSPADATYLDMQYPGDPAGPLGRSLGLLWADGPTSLRDAYDWDPADIVPGLADADILGVEAPIWTETVTSVEEIEFMAFPRLAAIAEAAWSSRARRDWDDFARRLPDLADRLDALGISWHRADDVAWRER
jgi:hexosaminidase